MDTSLRVSLLVLTLFTSFDAASLLAQTQGVNPKVSVVQTSLTAPGSPPFHLQAKIVDRDDPDNPANVELYWVSETKWRREIKSSDFSQTVIVNGHDIFDEHSDDYMPLAMETLLAAMTNPAQLLANMGTQDLAFTKSNGAANESGITCFGPAQPGSGMKLCGKGALGLREIVDVPGRRVQFMDYQKFFGQTVAREIITTPEIGMMYTARVTFLSQLENPDPDLFTITRPTPTNDRLRTAAFSENELRALLPEVVEIVWPQVLDGKTKGKASYFVSIDPEGQVRETVVVRSDNERANDSARRQIMRWRFKPPMKDGSPVQAEGVLSFTLDTRAWGPKSPLNNEEARKLATDIVEPNFPPGAPSGSICSVLIAVDTQGKVIEMIAGEGTPGFAGYGMKALQKWRFSPIMENGQPRPYRAQVDFRVP